MVLPPRVAFRALPFLLALLLVFLGGLAWYYLAARDTTAGEPATTTVAAAPNDKSIAVLPFADMSAGKDQEYFADGLEPEVDRNPGGIFGGDGPVVKGGFYRGTPCQGGIAEVTIPDIFSNRQSVGKMLFGSLKIDGKFLSFTSVNNSMAGVFS